MAFTTHKWELTEKNYLSFVNASNGQEFTSTLFEVDGIKFFLKCFPNGRKKPGLCNLYLTLSTEHFPSNIAKLKINYWLFCPQTFSRISDIRDFSADHNNSFHGWSTNTLNLKELENNSVNHITFQVGVNILKIYFKNEVARGSDINNNPQTRGRQPLIYEKPFKMTPKLSFNWSINEFMFKSFLSAPNKKCWESQQFDQWVLGCYPNGHSKSEQGNAMIYLKCVGLPPSIYGVKIRYTLFCPQTNLKWSYTQMYNYANTNYANATFKTATLQSLKSLSFEITIHVLQLYDLNRKEVTSEQLRKYLKLPSPSLLEKPSSKQDEMKRADRRSAQNEHSHKGQTAQQQQTQSSTNNNHQQQQQQQQHATTHLLVHDDGTFIPTNFDLYGTLQGIKEKLIGISLASKTNDDHDDDPYDSQISEVQEQVNVYSKELQSMNREIHTIRKGFRNLETRVMKSNQAFQTVLKQVKIIKNEVVTLKKETTESSPDDANNNNNNHQHEEKTNDQDVDDDDDDNKVNNGDVDNTESVKLKQENLLKLMESQNETMQRFQVEMNTLKQQIQQHSQKQQQTNDKEKDEEDENDRAPDHDDGSGTQQKYDRLMQDMNELKERLNEKDKQKETVDVNGLKEEIKQLRVDYDSMNESVAKLDSNQNMTDNKLVEEITNLKNEIVEIKASQHSEMQKLQTEMKEMKELNERLSAKLEQQEKDYKQELDGIREQIQRLNEQQSLFEQSSMSLVNVRSNDDDHKEDSSEDKERMKKVKDWVFESLQDGFNKTDLESIYSKFINDGFDDISLLSELTDETLASMGIHRRGDRIKILRACKSINTDETN